jgi:hypothetical protein
MHFFNNRNRYLEDDFRSGAANYIRDNVGAFYI